MKDQTEQYPFHTPAPRDVACEKGKASMENGVQHANAKLILPDGTEVELPLLQVSGMQSLYCCKCHRADLPLSVTTDANH